MPSAADPTPYVDTAAIKEKDYFGHRPVSSPLRHEHRSTEATSTHSIPRKPVGSPNRRQNNESSITTIHNPAISSSVRLAPATPPPQNTNIAQAGLGICLGGNRSPRLEFPPSNRSPSQRLESFFREGSSNGQVRRPTGKKSFSDLIPVSLDETGPDPPAVGPKPEKSKQASQNHHLPKRTTPGHTERSFRSRDPFELANERDVSGGMLSNRFCSAAECMLTSLS